MAPHSSTFAWKIPWTEEPGRLQSMGSLESDTTELLDFHFSLSCIGEGNGNPLQYSCLENPRAKGAWWAAVYGVAQSRTRLKRLSSSSRPPAAEERNPFRVSGWPGAQERWLGPQKTSERSGRGFSRPLMRSSGSWDSTEELGITEVSVLPMVTSLSSCRRCWRISCDKEKLLPSAGSGMRRGMCRRVKASRIPTPAHPEDLLGVSSNPPSATSSPPLATGTGVSWNPRASSGFRDKRILPSYF